MKKQRGRSLLGGLLVWGMILATLAAAAAAGAAWWWLQTPLRLGAPAVELSVEAGTPPREVAQAWVNAGVQEDARLLYQWFRWSGQSRQIRAGSYEIHQGATPRDLLAKMVRGVAPWWIS